MSDVDRRLQRLEREARVLRGLVAAAVLLLLGQGLLDTAPAEAARPRGGIRDRLSVEAESFVVRDDAGKIRAKLGMDRAVNAPVLYFYDQGGRGRMVLELDGNGRPRLALNAAGAVPSILLGGPDQSLQFFDQKQDVRVQLSLEKSGEPVMVLVTDEQSYRLPK